jgi:hypothetical protein
MTDAARFATVFHAAAKGAVAQFTTHQLPGYYGTMTWLSGLDNNPEYQRAKTLSDVFQAIGDVFATTAKAEQPTEQPTPVGKDPTEFDWETHLTLAAANLYVIGEEDEDAQRESYERLLALIDKARARIIELKQQAAPIPCLVTTEDVVRLRNKIVSLKQGGYPQTTWDWINDLADRIEQMVSTP